MMKRLLFLLCLICPGTLGAASLENGVARQVVVWFYDSSSGAPKTGLTVTSMTCQTVKSDMTAASFSPTASGGSHDMVEIANGAYKLELTTTDLNTNGVFELGCSISGSTSPPTVYDVIGTLSYGLTVDNDVATPSSFWAEPKAGAAAASYGELLNNMLPVSTGDISTLIGTPAQGDIATDILNVSRRQTAVTSGTAQAGGVTTITLAAGDFATSQIIKNGTLAIVGGTGAGQSAAINSYDGSTKIATITCLNSSNGQWVIYPNNTSIYVVYAASKR